VTLFVTGVCFTGHSFAVDGESMTNLDFAEFLVKLLGMEVPSGIEDTTNGEYYDILANMLATRGIFNFSGRPYGAAVKCSFLVDVVYLMSGESPALNADDKMAYLIENGYMDECPAGYGGDVSFEFVAGVFNKPGMAELVAVTYIAPPEGGTAGIPGAGAPQGVTENPSTQI
jgi:hypothetical protein